MRLQSYIKIADFFSSRKALKSAVLIANRGITAFMYAIYPALIIYLAIFDRVRLLRAVLVPAIGFIVLSVIRRLLNFERPYEKYDIIPLYEKSTKGCSFPSRHTFSAFIISLTILWLNPIYGILPLLLSVTMGILRIICMVHFPRDVICGAGFALLCALVGYIVI